MNNNQPEPVLAAPGAGLPLIELIVGNLIVKFKLLFATRAKAEQQFLAELQRIQSLISVVSEPALSKRVLIQRLTGMEDSSRYWSILMTLQHLVVVNNGTLELIRSLVEGRLPTRAVSTADVKPSPDVTTQVLADFEHSTKSFMTELSRLPEVSSKITWPHPWFGEFSASDWHFFAGFHMAIHRKQIEAILKGGG